MSIELSQRFYFEAAHTLQRKLESESSARIHGHTYHATVTISGQPDPQTGMLIDLAEFRKHIDAVRLQLDHHYLNELTELGPVTIENLCCFIYQKLQPTLPGLVRVSVERPASGDHCAFTRSKSIV